jgi:hypothetical protein
MMTVEMTDEIGAAEAEVGAYILHSGSRHRSRNRGYEEAVLRYFHILALVLNSSGWSLRGAAMSRLGFYITGLGR